MTTLTDNIRLKILRKNDDTAKSILTDEYLTLTVFDAKTFTNITDEDSVALRYYSCYLVANEWDTIMGLESREGVKYRKPNPQGFLDLYIKEVEDNPTDTTTDPYSAKVVTNTRLCNNPNGQDL